MDLTAIRLSAGRRGRSRPSVIGGQRTRLVEERHSASSAIHVLGHDAAGRRHRCLRLEKFAVRCSGIPSTSRRISVVLSHFRAVTPRMSDAVCEGKNAPCREIFHIRRPDALTAMGPHSTFWRSSSSAWMSTTSRADAERRPDITIALGPERLPAALPSVRSRFRRRHRRCGGCETPEQTIAPKFDMNITRVDDIPRSSAARSTDLGIALSFRSNRRELSLPDAPIARRWRARRSPTSTRVNSPRLMISQPLMNE